MRQFKTWATAMAAGLLFLATAPARPVVHMLNQGTDGELRFEVELSSVPAPPHQIQYSRDLCHWFPLGKELQPAGAGRYRFSDRGDSVRRFYRVVEYARHEVPVLLILLDFQETNFPPNVLDPTESPASSWSRLIFGGQQAQGNHYWNAVSYGRFSMLPARESQGVEDDGAIHVTLPYAAPDGASRFQDQPWPFDALDRASVSIDFPWYDIDGDGRLDNRELSVLFVINLPFNRIAGAGAEANIRIDHEVDGVTVEKVARTLSTYSSIGVNVHELGHQILGLEHGQDPRGSTLMGTGAYNEDPLIAKFTHLNSHWGTRPAHPSAESKARAGFVVPQTLRTAMRGVPLYSASSPFFNSVKIPTFAGDILLENRTKEGYDALLPFAAGHSGGLVATRVNEFRRLLRTSLDEFSYDFEDSYWFKGYRNELIVGGYRIHNISAPGTRMTFEIEPLNLVPDVQDYRLRYWIADPGRGPGYRLLKIVPATTPTIDFRTLSGSEKPLHTTFPLFLDGQYNTGDIVTLNHLASWTSENPYLKLSVSSSNLSGTEAFVHLQIDETQPHAESVTISISHEDYSHRVEVVHLPDLN